MSTRREHYPEWYTWSATRFDTEPAAGETFGDVYSRGIKGSTGVLHPAAIQPTTQSRGGDGTIEDDNCCRRSENQRRGARTDTGSIDVVPVE